MGAGCVFYVKDHKGNIHHHIHNEQTETMAFAVRKFQNELRKRLSIHGENEAHLLTFWSVAGTAIDKSFRPGQKNISGITYSFSL